MPSYPKMLPFLARRADISVELAEKLWRRAVGDAAELAGSAKGSDFHRFAIERFLDLIDDECCREQTGLPCSGWFWRYQRRIAAHSFKAASAGVSVWDEYWRKVRAGASFA